MSFRERNPAKIATITIVAVLISIVGSFQISKLPVLAGMTLHAEFAEAGGLKPGDPVQVAGVPVGKVINVRLGKGKVEVQLTAKDVTLGSETTAAIKTGTLLGARYIDLNSAGDGNLKTGGRIPIERTTSPYNVQSALNELAGEIRPLDLDLISEAIKTFSDTFRQSSDDIGPALEGVSALSKTISTRDVALRELFARAEKVTGTFRERTQQITKLVQDGNLLLAELQVRRAVIGRLIDNSAAVANQVSRLVKENQADLKPALDELNSVLRVLRKNQSNIVAAVKRAAAFITGLGEGVAHGPWFNGHVELPPGVVGLQQFAPKLPISDPNAGR
ncbi:MULTISPECIES: MCE family protein [unclassified Nocardioides]|uniref:MCE family protein n=1 Tax=unclassified Nocardioides TaxID=2615069 RepID=UPI0006F9429C|nr:MULTISPECIES: MCE family protein [unclassified Nocardioides]KRA31083.1 hypothetical protein ASD81_16490 [Nocardioides sp. Root614]KRA87703.1 hypothetical protein ASD84_16760 [Nocardioides sp. Root682]